MEPGGITITSQTKLEEADYSPGKIAALAVFATGAAAAAVYEWNEFLATFQPVFLVFMAAAFFAFLVSNVLVAFFVKNKGALAGIALAELAGPFFLFWSQFQTDAVSVLGAGFSAAFVFLAGGMLGARGVLANSLHIRFFGVANKALARFATAGLLALGVVFYVQCFMANSCKPGSGAAVVDKALDAGAKVAAVWYPKFTPDLTIRDFFREIALAQVDKLQPRKLTDQLDDQALLSLAPEARNQMVQKTSEAIQEAAERVVGKLDAGESVRAAAQRLVLGNVEKMSKTAKAAGAAAIAVALFFSARFALLAAYWAVNGFAFLVYKLLVAAGFAKVGYEKIDREFVVLP